MGGPSAAIVIAELVQLGARQLVRVGTCGALHPSLELGQLLIADEALTADGTSRALAGGHRARASEKLLDALLSAAQGGARRALVASTDLFYDGPPDQERKWLAAGAEAVEMETATLFALATRRGIESGAVLIVSDLLLPSRRRIDADRLRESEHRAGQLAVRALAL